MDVSDLGRATYLLILLVALTGWVLAEYRGRLGFAARTALAWGMIFLAVMAGFGLWQDLRLDGRLAGRPQQAVAAGGAITLPRAPDGHYYLTLQIGGQPVEFLVDTGATNVVLSRADARRLGIDPDALAYVGEAETANGTVRTARVTLQDVRLGPIADATLRAYVTEGDMRGSLLGMDYLGRYRIEIEADRMVLSR